MQRKSIKGFTIVELLVVIVIIGILASITLVSYVGAQEKARNVQILSTVNQWETILRAYETINGTFPNTELDYVCLGDSYPAEGPYLADQCMKAPGWGVSRSQQLINELKASNHSTVPNSVLPSLTFVNMSGDSEYYRGLLYLRRNGGFGITYALKGDGNTCAIGDSYFEGDGFVACRRVLLGDPYAGL